MVGEIGDLLIGKVFVSLEVGKESIVESFWNMSYMMYNIYVLFSCLLGHDAIFAFVLCRLVRTCPLKVFGI